MKKEKLITKMESIAQAARLSVAINGMIMPENRQLTIAMGMGTERALETLAKSLDLEGDFDVVSDLLDACDGDCDDCPNEDEAPAEADTPIDERIEVIQSELESIDEQASELRGKLSELLREKHSTNN